MAHFAKINEENIVQQVIVVNNSDCGGLEFPESESIGQSFINSIGLTGLADVGMTGTVTDNQVLTYNNTRNKWENKTFLLATKLNEKKITILTQYFSPEMGAPQSRLWEPQ